MHINTFDIIGNGIRTEVNNCLRIKLLLIPIIKYYNLHTEKIYFVPYRFNQVALL